jgi:hypothetical protein
LVLSLKTPLHNIFTRKEERKKEKRKKKKRKKPQRRRDAEIGSISSKGEPFDEIPLISASPRLCGFIYFTNKSIYRICIS